MILIALGSNLPSPRFGGPEANCGAALEALKAAGVTPSRVSRWYRSAPVPASDQPWFINGVAVVDTVLPPDRLLALLHGIERDFGRTRRALNEARVIDLDLLAHGARVSGPGEVPVLPHPRLAERAFVVRPLAELVPAWRHPVTGLNALEMADRLPGSPAVEPLERF